MNMQRKRFLVKRVWTRIKKAHTIIWLHRNSMTSRQKQSLLRGLHQLDAKAEFIWINASVLQQVEQLENKTSCFEASEKLNTRLVEIRSILSQGPSAILLLAKPAPDGFWKWILGEHGLCVLAAQQASQPDTLSNKQWYNSEQITQQARLRFHRVYSDLLSVLQVPFLFTSLLNKHSSTTPCQVMTSKTGVNSETQNVFTVTPPTNSSDTQ